MGNLKECEKGKQRIEGRERYHMNGGRSVAFIGSGHITEIILRNIIANRVLPGQQILLSDVDSEHCRHLAKEFGTGTCSTNREAFARADVTFICIPPRFVASLVSELQGEPVLGKAIVTIAAGVPMRAYEAIGEGLAVLRTLPNPPSQIGQGVLPYAANRFLTPCQKEEILKLLSSLGECLSMDEASIDVVTSLSSPAPVCLFLDTMVEAGVLAGLSRKDAEKVSFQTVQGCLKVFESRPEASFADLAAEASTPGGTSVESLYVLDQRGFRGAIKEAYLRAAEKARKATEMLKGGSLR